MGKRGEALARERAVRNRRIEAIALGVLALLPIVPYLTFLLRTGVPRYGLVGDHALLEQATRHVFRGDTLLGLVSRFTFNHPGPLFFYLTAPLEAAFGSASTGLYISTCLVNAAAAAAIVACTRIFGRRSHAVAALLVVFTWFVAFGNVAADPWGPLVIVLPLAAFLVNAAMFARGKSAAAYPAVVFGTLAAQTHVAAAPTAAAVGLVALVAFLIGARRRGGLERDERWRLAFAASVLIILFVPPLVEQIVAPSGNMKELCGFFVHRTEPRKPLADATAHWTLATSWLPERVFTRALVAEGPIPLVRRADAMRTVASPNARLVAIVHVMSIAIAAIVAGRRRDVPSISLLAIGTIADAAAVFSLQAVVGPVHHFLVFWTTAASSVAWIGVLGTFFAAVGAIGLRMPRVSGILAPALVTLILAAAVTSTSLQRFWLARNAVAPSSRPDLRADLRAIEEALRARLQRDGSIVTVHREGARDIADALVLELEKDGVDVRVANADRHAYSGVRTANGVAKPLHVWFSTTAQPLRLAPCLELVTKSGDVAVYGAPEDTTSCLEGK
jgi:hypothetical protein